MCIDLVNSDSAVVSGPRVTDFPTVPEVKYEKLTQTIARVTHVYSEGYELMVPPNATIQVTCSQVKVQSPTFNCSHDYLMINSARFCNNNFPQAPFTFTSGNPGSQESMIVLKTASPQRAAYSCQLQVVRRYPKRVIDLIKHVEYTLDVSGKAYRQETDFVILAPKKSFVVMSCPVFEVSDYWPCKQSYVTVELQKYCHFPTAHKVEIEIPPTGTASIAVKLASSPNDRVQCVLHRIAGKKTACVESPNTPTYVGAPEQRAQICVNMVASPIVKIVSPFRDEMETEMDMTVRYEVMSVPHMVHYLWCNDFRLDTDCSKERLHWFNYNDRLCGHSRPRDFTYSYGSVNEKATYSLTYKKQRGVRQGHFSCFLYREPQTKGTYTLDLFSKNSATIEKHPSKRIFPHDSQVITYYVLAPPDSEVIVTCSAFNIQSGPDCSNSYLKINDRQYCDSNVPGRQRLELTYNYAAVVFRDGKDASNSFSCTFERGSSSDKCAFEQKHPTTTLSPWETVPTTESSMTETPFTVEGVTTVPSAATLITPFTEATVPWYSVGSTTLRTLKYSPSVTPEEGATFPETPFPGASTEYPTEFPLLPQQQATRPSLPTASIAVTTEVGMPPEAASPSTGLVPAISQSVSPAQLPSVASTPHQEVSPASPPEGSVVPTTETSPPPGASFTPNEAVPSRPFGISMPETFPPGASVFPTTQMSLPSGVPSEEPSASIPIISNAATAPDTMTGGTPTSVTGTPLGPSVVPTSEVSLPTGASGKPNFVPSVSMGLTVSDTVTAFPAVVTQEGIPATSLPGVSLIPTGSVSFPSSMFSQPVTGIPSVTGGLSVPVMITGTPAPFPHEEVNTSSPPGLSVAPTTETSFPSGVSGEPTLIVPTLSLDISVPEITGTPPTIAQKESTATIPSGMLTVPTSETSIPSFMTSPSTGVVPSFSPGVSFPSTYSVSRPPTYTEGIIPSAVPATPTTNVSLPSTLQGQPTAFIPSMSVSVSTPQAATGTQLPSRPYLTGTFPSGVSIIPTTEVSRPFPEQQLTTMVPSVSASVSLVNTGIGTLPASPQEEMTTPFSSGPSGLPTTEVSLPSGASGQPTAVVPSVSLGVSVPGTQTGSQPALPYGEITTPFPSGPSGIPSMEVPTTGVPGQPTAIVPSVSVGVSVTETGEIRPQSFPKGELTSPFPTGPSGLPTTEVSIPSFIPGQPTSIVPPVPGVSVPETQTSSPPSFPHGELTTPFPSGPSGIPNTEVPPLSGVTGQPTAFVSSVSVGVSVPETEGSSPPPFPQEGFTTPFPTGPSGLPTTEVSIPSGISGQPTGIVPSVSVGVSVPETQTSSPPSYPHEELTTPFPSGPSGIPNTEVPPLSGVPGQPTAIVPSVSVGVSVPETEGSRPAFPQEGLTTPFPTGPSGLPTTELSIPSGIPGQPTGIVPSISVGVSVPETQTSSPPPFPHGELTTPFPSGPSGIPNTEVPPLSGAPGEPTAIVPSVSVGVSVPETEGSRPAFPQEGLTTPFPTGPSGLPTTEVSIPSGIPGQPTGIVPSVSVGVSVPETQTSSPPSYPHEELTTPFPSGPSGIPNTEVPPLSGVPGQPTAIVPSVSVGVSVPETEGSRPAFPQEGLTTPFPTGPSGLPTTELSIPSGIPGQPTGIVPSVSVGVSVPETQTSSIPSFPHGEQTTPFPSGPSGIPNTEVPPLSGAPGEPTAIVPSVSVGVSVPETEGSHPAFPQEGLTTPFPTGPSGLPTTELSIPSGIPGQPTGIIPSVSVGVSVPETQTSSPPSFPHGELTTPFPSGPSGIPNTEVPPLSSVPGQPTAVVPSVSVGVSVPETEGSSPPPFPQEGLTTPFPTGPSGLPTTDVSVPSGIPGQPTGIVPSVSVGVSVPETQTSSPPSFPHGELTTTFTSGPSGIPNTEVPPLSSAPGQPTAVVPSVSVGVSVPETGGSSPLPFPEEGLTTPFPTGPSGLPTTEVSIPSGITGQPTGIVPSVSVGVSVPETQTGSPPSFPHRELTTPFPSGPSGIPNTEVPPLSGVPGQPTAVVPSVSVGVSVPETEGSSPLPFPQEGLTTPFPTGPSGLLTTEVSISSGIPGQPTGIVPSVSVGVSVPETQTGSQPSFPHGELTTPFPSGPSGIPNTEVPPLSGVPGQPTAIVPSVSVGVTVSGTEGSRPPAFPQEGLTTPFATGPSGLPTTEVSMPSGITGQPTGIVPSVSVGVSVPETQTSNPPSFPHGELTTPFPSGPSGIPNTEVPPLSGVPGQPTVIVPSVSVGVSVPGTESSRPPAFPQEGLTTPFATGPSGLPTTEVSMPSGIPGQPTGIVPSVSVGVSVPETQTSSPPSFPHGELTTPFPSGPSGIPNTEVPPLSGVPGQPTVIVPSVSVGVSVPGTESSRPPAFPQEGLTTPFATGPSGLPTTEVSMPSGITGQPTGIVPSVSVGVSVPETQTSSPPSFPHGELTTPFPSGPSGIPNTEVPPLSGVPGQPTAIVPSVSVGVTVPGTEGSRPPAFLQEGLTKTFPTGPSGLPTTEVSMPSGIPGQPTGIVPSVTVGVSVPETQTSSPPSFPHGELTTPFPSGPSGIPNTEVPPLSGVPGQPTAIVPSVSVRVSGPQAETTKPPFGTPGFTATLPSGAFTVPTKQMSPSGTPGQPIFPSGVPSFPTTEVPIQSGASSEQSTVAASVSLAASLPEGVTFPQPTFSEEHVSGAGASFPTTELSVPSNAPFKSTLIPSMSVGVSVPQESTPSSLSYPAVTGTLPPAMSVVPTGEVSLPRGGPGEPTAMVPSATVSVSLPGASFSTGEASSTFPSGGSAVPTTEVSLPSGITGLPSVAVTSFSVGVSMPETATSTAGPLTVETRTLPSGFPVSETMPGTPAPWPSSLPHGTPGAPTNLPTLSFGSPSISSEHPPTLPEGISVETETGTPVPSEELHETTELFTPSPVPTTYAGFPSSLPRTPVSVVPEVSVSVSVPPGFVPSIATVTAPSFYGTKNAPDFTSTPRPYQTGGVTGPEEAISTTLPPSLFTPETEEIRILLKIIRTDLKTYKVNATVLHTFLIKATTIGSHDAYTIILLALKDIKVSCKYLAPSERIKVAYEIAHYLKSHGTRIAHDVVVKAVGVFLCAVDHKDIITKLLSENSYMISISESVASELSCPDMEHLIHLLYADRNRTKVEESPCAGILCEEVPENVMDTIDMLVDRYFPQKAHEKKWLMLDIAKALNLQPEEDEEGDEMVYYKMGDYDVFLEELREPTISDEERALLFGKFFAEVRKVAKAERKLRLDDLEEVWKMGGGKLPQPAVRSFIALLKLVHSKRLSLKTEERIRLLKLALKCDGHECTKLSSSDIHNLIFALCNVGIRDGFGLPKDLKSQVTKFILTLKDNYIDSISIRRWKRSSSLLKPKSHDYLSASSPSELRYLKDWLQKPMSFSDNKGLLKNTGRSNDDPSGNKKSVLSQLYNAYVNEKRPDIKTVLAERLLDTYNTSFKHLGAESEDTEKFVLSVVQQLPSTTSRHNDLVLGILEQCIRRGDPCLNTSRSESIAPLKVIMQNMSLKQSPNFVRTLSHDLFAAAKKARTHIDLSWLTDSGTARRTSQTTVPQVLQVSSRSSIWS
ncbi:mucin-2-like isoform X2 [Dermacentor albipictus]